jgi:hypothetical protein
MPLSARPRCPGAPSAGAVPPQRPQQSRILASRSSTCSEESDPTKSVSLPWSIVMTWNGMTALSRGSGCPAGNRTCNRLGRTLVVIAATTTTGIVRLKLSIEMTTAGRLPACSIHVPPEGMRVRDRHEPRLVLYDCGQSSDRASNVCRVHSAASSANAKVYSLIARRAAAIDLEAEFAAFAGTCCRTCNGLGRFGMGTRMHLNEVDFRLHEVLVHRTDRHDGRHPLNGEPAAPAGRHRATMTHAWVTLTRGPSHASPARERNWSRPVCTAWCPALLISTPAQKATGRAPRARIV